MDNLCPRCGGTLGPRAAFCIHCGKAVSGVAAPGVGQLVPLIGRSRGGSASWPAMRRLLYFYSALMACSLALGLVSSLGPAPVLDVAFSGVWIGITLWFLRTEWAQVSSTFRWSRQRAQPWTLVGAAVLVAVFLEVYFSAFDFLGMHVAQSSRPYLDAGWPVWSIFIMVSIEPGVIEEVAFRGILQTRLAKITTRNEALVIQAALFSILHLSPAIFISHFVMGLFLGWVRQRTGRVYAGMLLHMAWNAWVLVQEIVPRSPGG